MAPDAAVSPVLGSRLVPAVLPVDAGTRDPRLGMYEIRQGQELCRGSGDVPGGLLMPGRAVEDTFPDWLCEPQGVLGRVAGRDLGRETGRPGNRGRAGWHEIYPVGQKFARVEGSGQGRLAALTVGACPQFGWLPSRGPLLRR